MVMDILGYGDIMEGMEEMQQYKIGVGGKINQVLTSDTYLQLE
jgi:hypothetical protein